MARKDKKPEIPPPSPSSSSATSSSSDATSTDSPPPKINTISDSPKPATLSEQDDTASSSDADTDVSTPKTNTTANKTDAVSSSAASDDSDSDSPPPKQQPISTSKRPAENHTTTPVSGPEKKKSKKENIVISALPTTNVAKRATETGGTAATPHKQLFQRIWSDGDEIVILKGMIEYKANKRTDPMSNVDDILDFIKKSLKVADANKGQVVNKVKRLKTKFQNAKKKKTLTNPHEIEAFKLSKLIWGDEIEAEDSKVEKDEGWVIRKCEDLGEGKEIDAAFGFSEEDEVILKEAMKVMEGNERKELKKKVKIAKKVLDDLKES